MELASPCSPSSPLTYYRSLEAVQDILKTYHKNIKEIPLLEQSSILLVRYRHMEIAQWVYIKAFHPNLISRTYSYQ